jgi:hypothetical protein
VKACQVATGKNYGKNEESNHPRQDTLGLFNIYRDKGSTEEDDNKESNNADNIGDSVRTGSSGFFVSSSMTIMRVAQILQKEVVGQSNLIPCVVLTTRTTTATTCNARHALDMLVCP